MSQEFLNALIRIRHDSNSSDKIKGTAVDAWRNTKQRSFKIEANFHLITFIIKVCEIYYIHSKYIPSWPAKYDSSIQKQLLRGLCKKHILRNSCPLTLTTKTVSRIFLKNTCKDSPLTTFLKNELIHSYFSRILISFLKTPLSNCLCLCFTFVEKLILIFLYFQVFLVFSLKRDCIEFFENAFVYSRMQSTNLSTTNWEKTTPNLDKNSIS